MFTKTARLRLAAAALALGGLALREPPRWPRPLGLDAGLHQGAGDIVDRPVRLRVRPSPRLRAAPRLRTGLPRPPPPRLGSARHHHRGWGHRGGYGHHHHGGWGHRHGYGRW